jgi:hypothetical protein
MRTGGVCVCQRHHSWRLLCCRERHAHEQRRRCGSVGAHCASERGERTGNAVGVGYELAVESHCESEREGRYGNLGGSLDGTLEMCVSATERRARRRRGFRSAGLCIRMCAVSDTQQNRWRRVRELAVQNRVPLVCVLRVCSSAR